MINGMMGPKYKGQTLEFDLSKWGYKNYIAQCLYCFNRTEGKYSLSIWINRKDIGDRMRLSSKEVGTQCIHGTKETIYENICRVVHQACISGYFDHFVERYEYELACFERGNEIFEKERLNESNGGAM